MKKDTKALRLYTHTHTHHISSGQKWSKGGSREHRDVAIFPRDCRWYRIASKLSIQQKNKKLALG